MLEIYLFSKNNKVLSYFKKIRKSKLFSIVVYNPKNYKQILRNINQDIFVYMDISSFDDLEQKQIINYITRQKRFDFGIIDPKNNITDSANLFHKGASDYIGKSLLAEGEAKAGRIKNSVIFYTIEDAEDQISEPPSFDDIPTMLSGHNWDNIVIGNEYTFCMLHIEIDILPEWASKSGRAHIEEVMNFFYSHINRIITPLNGRMWMKSDFGGMVLFPYDGSCTPIIIECIKLVMDRIIFSAEEYTYNTILTYKIAMDIGNTKYLTSGNTGNIISDSVNFIFHFGKQYAKPGNFYLTGRLKEDIPPGLLDYFYTGSRFQDRTIYQMKLPVFK